MPLTQTSRVDYEEPFKLDVLGLADSPSGDQGVVYDELRNSCGGAKKGGTKPLSRGRETILPCQTARSKAYADSLASSRNSRRMGPSMISML